MEVVQKLKFSNNSIISNEQKRKYNKYMKQKGFFDEEDSLKKLSCLSNPIKKLNIFIN